MKNPNNKKKQESPTPLRLSKSVKRKIKKKAKAVGETPHYLMVKVLTEFSEAV